MGYKISILYKKYPFPWTFYIKITNKKMVSEREKTFNLDTTFSDFELFLRGK